MLFLLLFRRLLFAGSNVVPLEDTLNFEPFSFKDILLANLVDVVFLYSDLVRVPVLLV